MKTDQTIALEIVLNPEGLVVNSDLNLEWPSLYPNLSYCELADQTEFTNEIQYKTVSGGETNPVSFVEVPNGYVKLI